MMYTRHTTQFPRSPGQWVFFFEDEPIGRMKFTQKTRRQDRDKANFLDKEIF